MCGIFGWSIPKDAEITPEQRVALTRALFALNDVRGGDSWGLAILRNGNVLDITKGLGEAWKGVSYKDHHLEETELLFGHTRKATTGDKTIPNSHPFEIACDKDPGRVIIGAHNGMICEHEKLNTKYSRKYEVDSMHIFGHIVNDIPTRELAGYGACEYVMKDKPEVVKLFKFNSGELSVAGLNDTADPKSSKGVIWSSSFMQLELALKITGLPNHFMFAGLDTERIYDVYDGHLFNTKEPRVFGPGYSSGNSYTYTTGGSSHSSFRGHYSGQGSALREEDIEDYTGEGGQGHVWGETTMGVLVDTDYEIWHSDNFVIKRRKNSTSLMRTSSDKPLTPSAPKLENEPTAPDETTTEERRASEAIVAELSAA